MKITAYIFALLLVMGNNLFAQPLQIPLHQSVQSYYERKIPDSALPAFTSVRPYQTQWLTPWMEAMGKDSSKGLKNRLLNGHLIRFEDDQFRAWIDPILGATIGRASKPSVTTYHSGRGVQAGMAIGKQVGIGFAFTENQSRFPGFVNNYIRQHQNVVPGMGKGRTFKNNGYDYAFSDAYLRYAPGKIFSATLGYGQNFLGEGYRSLFLSDNTMNYPFLQLNLNLRRLHYTVLYNQYDNTNTIYNSGYQRKWSTLHYLTVKLGKRWQVGLFEGVVWQAEDSVSKRGFELAYLSPVPFMRPIEFSRGSPDNMLMGLHGKYLLAKRTYAYAQILLDDLNIQASNDSNSQHLNNKYAVQVGVKSFIDFGGCQWALRTEYNHARPYTYGHRRIAQSYTHYQQPLAHPIGANFHEAIGTLAANRNGWYAEMRHVLAWVGREDVNTPYPDGNDLFGGEAGVPAFGNTTLQGLRTKQMNNYFAVGFVINPRWNLALETSFLHRRTAAHGSPAQSNVWFNVGLTTRLRNQYFDF